MFAFDNTLFGLNESMFVFRSNLFGYNQNLFVFKPIRFLNFVCVPTAFGA